jgi:HlyD family secretion protein
MAWYDRVRTSIRTPALLGAAAIFVGLGGFGTWAAVAPLQGAVIAPGTVTTLGRNKFIQHLEGGIVREVLVAEGMQVVAGQTLMTLDPTVSLTTRNRLRSQLDSLGALEARALAERAGAQSITFPQALRDSTDPTIIAAVEDQAAEFEARLGRFQNEQSILGEQISSLRQEIIGYEAQQEAVRLQLDLVEENMADLETLLEGDLVVKTRVLDARGRQAQLLGQEGQVASLIAASNLSIGEKEYERQRLENARLEEASSSLVEVRRQRTDLLEQLQAAEDQLLRTSIVSPESGTVANISPLGPGSVITPGQRVMEILPAGADLIVEAQVRPTDIDQIYVGQEARLVFAALDPRTTPQVLGHVTYISVDALENERTGEPFYIARLEIPTEPLAGFDPAEVGAGQPVEVYMTTGERTFLNYVVDPLLVTFRRAARE